MKKNILIIVAIVFAYGIYANPIDKNKAEQIAKNFYFANSGSEVSKKEALVTEFTIEKSYDNQVCFYIQKYLKNGFVIVSADDAFMPVLGFSLDDNFDKNSISPEFEFYLASKAREMIASGRLNTAPVASIKKAWSNYEKSNITKNNSKNTEVLPLLTTRWGQEKNYNYYCPESPYGSDGRCVTGCVATAMAQVIKFHKYPATGNSSHSYYDPFYTSISADFGSTTYEYDKMTNVANSQSKDAISKLMFHCGVSVNMKYGPNESSSFGELMKPALVNYFKYSTRAEYKYKESYTDDDWSRMLMADLDNGLPILYGGSASNFGGHMWVCDGYKIVDDSCFVHMNWGWNGSQNLYFYVSKLNPVFGTGNAEFNIGEAALFNVAPYDYDYCNKQKKVYDYSAYSFNDGSNYSKYWNNTDCDWLIAPKDNSPVIITIKKSQFETEADNDVLTIYDGENASAPVLASFSGSLNKDTTFSSNGPKAYVLFKTNDANQYQGWTLSYKTVASGIDDVKLSDIVSISPNPASELIKITLKDQLSNDAQIELMNILGERIISEKISKGTINKTIDISSVNNGIYFLTITSNKAKSVSKMIINR